MEKSEHNQSILAICPNIGALPRLSELLKTLIRSKFIFGPKIKYLGSEKCWVKKNWIRNDLRSKINFEVQNIFGLPVKKTVGKKKIGSKSLGP